MHIFQKPASYVLVLLLFFQILTLINSQVLDDKRGKDNEILDPIDVGSTEFIKVARTSCDREFRELDGSCTNRQKRAAGSASTAQYSYFENRGSLANVDTTLPSARLISNVMSSQSVDVLNKRGMNEFVVFFGQFLDHTIVASVSSDEALNIETPLNDPKFGNTSTILPFRRALTAVPERYFSSPPPTEVRRPINILSSAIDLASVYGSSEERSNELRTNNGDGKLRTSDGNLLPFNTFLINAPTPVKRVFVAGDHRANEHPTLTSFHTLFLREHNLLAEELKKAYPEFTDEQLFQYARKINIAQFQKVTYEEFFPTITGRRLGRYKGHRTSAIPAVSVEFSTAAYRLGHTMVGNQVTRRGPKNAPLPSIPMQKMFFPNPQVLQDNGIDPFLRGAMSKQAQEVDTLVVDALRNFLFTGVFGETGIDLISLNIQRSRDNNLVTYNTLRREFIGSRATTFSDITKNRLTQSKLQTAYGTVDKVEAWIGLLSEDHVSGGSMGRTMLKIWEEEFARLRDGDRFFWQVGGLFKADMISKVKRLGEIYSEKDTMKKILLRNTDITESEMGSNIWFVNKNQPRK